MRKGSETLLLNLVDKGHITMARKYKGEVSSDSRSSERMFRRGARTCDLLHDTKLDEVRCRVTNAKKKLLTAIFLWISSAKGNS